MALFLWALEIPRINPVKHLSRSSAMGNEDKWINYFLDDPASLWQKSCNLAGDIFMAAKSPNYPALDLGTALARMQTVYAKENRNKMSRTVLAKHLGYNSMSGRALTALGAVRSYGLVDGSGDELKISDATVAALKAPAGSDARKNALEHLATRPALFKDLRTDFPDDLPSDENIQFWLAKRGFTGKGAGKAAKSYLTTMSLVIAAPAAYSVSSEEEEDEEMPDQTETVTTAPRPRNSAQEIKDDFSVLLQGRRLKINATVDADGIKRLKAVLEKYEEILNLLQ